MLIIGTLTAGCGGADGGDAASGRSPVTSTIPASVPTGTWAGESVILTVTPDGATVEFECASGEVPHPLSLDPGGHFDAPGSYVAHSGGPVSSTDPTPEPWPADYRGRLTDASHMRLTVVLSQSGTTQGAYELELGGEPSLERCV